jgi:hypothetical protein
MGPDLTVYTKKVLRSSQRRRSAPDRTEDAVARSEPRALWIHSVSLIHDVAESTSTSSVSTLRRDQRRAQRTALNDLPDNLCSMTDPSRLRVSKPAQMLF